jgi:1-deoxy-D-xylulose-5-phosphate reductoisomerase
MKRVTILGSTGSIGRSTLEVISSHKDKFKIVGLTAGSNIDLLEQQIKKFLPDLVAVEDKEHALKLEKRLGRRYNSVKIFTGIDGISYVAAYNESDYVISAIVGSAGLFPTLSAIKAHKVIGLANKEALVMAGSILMAEAQKNNSRIIPVDSEHSAIFQCIEGYKCSDIRKIILTASGGPFLKKAKKDMKYITPSEALKHPRWKMGKKITIDSATLMNKGFEIIEAHHLFGVPIEDIEVIIHPESIIHSIVEFKDRSCIAQLSYPDMKGPIAYALTYPERLNDVIPSLEFSKLGSLTFLKPDFKKFPCLSYAYNALKAGGTMPSVLNAANEIAVSAFLKGLIKFTEIPIVIKKTMNYHVIMPCNKLDTIIEADKWAKEKAKEIINSMVK